MNTVKKCFLFFVGMVTALLLTIFVSTFVPTGNAYAFEQKLDVYLGAQPGSLYRFLSAHENDGYLLGTPYRSIFAAGSNQYNVMSPNGDPYNGSPSLSCTGLVAYSMRAAGADIEPIGQVANRHGGIANGFNWEDFCLVAPIEKYSFATKNEMMSSGVLEKGDIIYMKSKTAGADMHTGFFWGENPYDEKFFHSHPTFGGVAITHINDAWAYTYYVFKNSYIGDQSRWEKWGDSWVYFKSDGQMKISGWEFINGKWYYFDAAESNGQTIGVMYNGSKRTIDGVPYRFRSGGDMLVGWVKENNKWIYFGQNGKQCKNQWVFYNSEWYYLKADGSMADNEWISDDTGTYLLLNGGRMARGWVEIETNTWVYFGGSGCQLGSQWIFYQNQWYYLKSDGIMASDEFLQLDTEYYITKSGAMHTGWLNIGKGNWKHYRGDGRLSKKCWVGNYYLKKDGTMARDEWIGQWYVDDTGEWIE